MNYQKSFTIIMKGYFLILHSIFIRAICTDSDSLYVKTNVIPEIHSCTEKSYNKALSHHESLSTIVCARLCSSDQKCRRFMFDEEKKICSLFESGENCIASEDVNTKVCYRQKYICGGENCTRCPIGYYGDRCQHVIKDCKEGRDKNVTPAGIILLSFIQPSVNGTVVEVKCDFRSSTRTYVYIRETNCLEIDGNKTFNEYSNGFGHTVGNYFLGLEHIYNILQIGYFSMGIRFEFDGQVAKGYYHKFVIDSKANNYRLSIGFFQNDSAFSCGDSVINGAFSLNGRPFSTLDHDLTNHSCPVRFGGGWWYLDNHVCSRSNVNGRRSGNNFESTWHWQDTLGKTTSFSSMNMFLRYKNNQS